MKDFCVLSLHLGLWSFPRFLNELFLTLLSQLWSSLLFFLPHFFFPGNFTLICFNTLLSGEPAFQSMNSCGLPFLWRFARVMNKHNVLCKVSTLQWLWLHVLNQNEAWWIFSFWWVIYSDPKWSFRVFWHNVHSCLEMKNAWNLKAYV